MIALRPKAFLGLLLTGTFVPTATVFAQQGWEPSISTRAELEVSKSEETNGWFPVVIRPPASNSRQVATEEVETKSRDPDLPKPVPVVPLPRPKPVISEPTVTSSVTPARNVELPSKERSQLADAYCANIADAALDARFAWQVRILTEMEKELDRRIALLEQRAAEYREWLSRREAFIAKARETLVQIYSRMRPDAAASQLANLDEETAAAVLVQLNPRSSSAILNEMPPGAAARLTATIAGATKRDDQDKKDEPRL